MKSLDFDTVDGLIDEIKVLCADINGAEFRLLELIRRLDLLRPWRECEVPSCAHWLNLRCGIDLVTAREKVRVAHALPKVPMINEAFRDGRLSYSKVRALTRVAGPETEAELLSMAVGTTASHVEKLARTYRQAERLQDARAAFNAYRQREFRCHTTDDGSLVFVGRLPAEVGALLVQALDRGVEWLFRGQVRPQPGAYQQSTPGDQLRPDQQPAPHRQQRPEAQPMPDRRPVSQARPPAREPARIQDVPLAERRADALAALAERFLAQPPEEEEGLNSADRFLVTVHASAEALPEYGELDPRDPPQVEDGPVLAAETVRRIACDCGVVHIRESSEGEPLDVGRKTRTIPSAIRRALKRRDLGCRFPGCVNSRFVDGHHIVHWADGGETKLSNLVLLCRHHHRLLHEGLLHEGGYYVVPDGSEFIFCRGDGDIVLPVTNAHRSVGRSDGPAINAPVAARSKGTGPECRKSPVCEAV